MLDDCRYHSQHCGICRFGNAQAVSESSIKASAELQTVSSIEYSTLKLLPEAKDMR